MGRRTERAFTRLQRQQLRQQDQAAAARTVWPQRKEGQR